MRITIKHLEQQVTALNESLNLNPHPYTSTEAGAKANIGTYYIDSAYGAYRVVRLVSESGGLEDVSPRGSARETYTFILNMLHGIEAANNNQ